MLNAYFVDNFIFSTLKQVILLDGRTRRMPWAMLGAFVVFDKFKESSKRREWAGTLFLEWIHLSTQRKIILLL